MFVKIKFLLPFLLLLNVTLYPQKVLYLDSCERITSEEEYDFKRIIEPHPVKKFNYLIYDYYRNGQLFTQGMAKSGNGKVKSGDYMFHHSNGKMLALGKIEHGKKSGTWTYFDKRGNEVSKDSILKELPVLKQNYDSTKRIGKCLTYYKEGEWKIEDLSKNEVNKEYYIDGVLVVNREGSLIYDEKASYKGGFQKFYEVLSSSLEYSDSVRKQVYVRFEIDTSGNVIDTNFFKPIDDALKIKINEAILSTSGNWIPAKLNGENVNSFVVLPITFIPKRVDEGNINDIKAELELQVSKNKVYQYEPVILTVTFKLFNNNNVPIQFNKDLPNNIFSIIEQVKKNRAWTIENKINNIRSEKFEGGVKYDLYQIALCSFDTMDIKIPPLSIKIDQVDSAGHFLKQKIFETKARTIQVEEFQNHSVYKNDLYAAVGEYVLSTYPENKYSGKVGDTLNLKVEIRGNALTYPIADLIRKNDNFDILEERYANSDRILNDEFLGKQEISYLILFKKSGLYSLSEYLNFKYYSLNSSRVKTLTPSLIFEIEEKQVEYNARLPELNTILALDISQSMQIEDFEPNRLDAILNSLRSIDIVCDYLTILYRGKTVLLNNICDFEPSHFNLPEGTAIGNAIWRGIEQFDNAGVNDDNKIILIGDGDYTAGVIDAIEAAQIARDKGIRIHCIGVGSKGMVPFGKDELGNTRYVKNTFSDDMLKKIAAITGGSYYQYENREQFREIINQIVNHK